MKKKTKDFKGFYETLCETIESEKGGVYREIIKYAPSFFRLLCNMLSDKRTDWHTKLVISAALSYFVVPNDIIPEDEYGVVGYVDDVFICSYVLEEIKNKVSGDLLIDNCDEKEDILCIVDEIFSKSKKVIGNKYDEILKLVGLRKGKIPTIDVKGKEKPSKKIERLIYEKNELLGLLAYITRVLYRAPSTNRNIKSIKEYLLSQDEYKEIEKILKYIKFMERMIDKGKWEDLK